MSDINVRVWNNNTKTMLYFHPVTLTDSETEIAAQQKVFDREDWIDTYTAAPNKDLVTMLESGFQGVWENDVLDGKAPMGVVRFGVFDNKKEGPDHQSGSGFYLETREGIRSLSALMLRLYEYKVIGNICEKPELLKLCIRE